MDLKVMFFINDLNDAYVGTLLFILFISILFILNRMLFPEILVCWYDQYRYSL